MTFVSIFWFDVPEGNEGLKRRRLEAAGQENRSPKPSSSRRLAELETKPDTPIVPSVRTRVQQLTQRRDGKTNNNIEADANIIIFPILCLRVDEIVATPHYKEMYIAIRSLKVHFKIASASYVKLLWQCG